MVKNDNENSSNVRICVHCGSEVSGGQEICPNCGLSVEINKGSSSADNNVKEPKKASSSDAKKKSFKFDSKTIIFIGLAVVIVISMIVAFVLTRPSITRRKISKNETVVSQKDLKDRLNVDIKEPDGAEEIVYTIENESIAKASYKKTVSDGQEMNFILRSSYSTEEIENSIGLDVEFAYTPIMMTVICDDGSEVPVESKVALDDDKEMKYMKALWFDNDKYYSMVTDNLVTREDFLQEVNRVIINNHVPF